MSNRSRLRIKGYLCKISLKVPIGGAVSKDSFWRGWIYISRHKGGQFVNLRIFQDHGSDGDCHGISSMIRSRLLNGLEAVSQVNMPIGNNYNFSFTLSKSASFIEDFLPTLIDKMREVEYANCEHGWEIREVMFDGVNSYGKTTPQQFMDIASGKDLKSDWGDGFTAGTTIFFSGVRGKVVARPMDEHHSQGYVPVKLERALPAQPETGEPFYAGKQLLTFHNT
jgi:hypothetical protein